MKKDHIILIFFIILVIFLGILISYNSFVDREQDVNRKVEILLNRYSYNTVYNMGTKLFTNAITLLDNNKLEYEKNEAGNIKFYNINNYKEYKKLMNFDKLFKTFTEEDIKDYLTEKKIIEKDNYYYIENYSTDYNYNYIGSNIEIINYDDTRVYFESINYYCNNGKYIGILNDVPNCDYTVSKTTFNLILENDSLKIEQKEDIEKIIE